MHDDKNVVAAQMPEPLPEKIEINGVTYVRQANWIDECVNQIASYQAIARRTGITLQQAIWFRNRQPSDQVMPD